LILAHLYVSEQERKYLFCQLPIQATVLRAGDDQNSHLRPLLNQGDIYWLAIKKKIPEFRLLRVRLVALSLSLARLGIKSRAFSPFVCSEQGAHPTGTSVAKLAAMVQIKRKQWCAAGAALHLLLSLLLHAHIRTNCRVVCQTLLVFAFICSSGMCLLKGGNPPVIKGVAELRFDWGKQIAHTLRQNANNDRTRENCRIVNVYSVDRSRTYSTNKTVE
jgi:hypothetical protein